MAFSGADGERRSLIAILDNFFAFVAIFSVDGRVVEVNPTALERAGLCRAEIIGQPLWDSDWLSHSNEQRDRIRAALDMAAAGETVRLDLKLRIGESEEIALDCRFAPLFDDRGEIDAIVCCGVDVSDRDKILGELKAERDFARDLVEIAPVIVLVLDTDGRIEHVNPYFEQLTGFDLDEIRRKDWFDTLLPERERERVRALFRTAMNGVPTTGSVNPILTRTGSELDIEWYDQVVRDEDGRAISLLAIGQDVSDRRRAQEAVATSETRLKEAQRIARIGSWEFDLVAGTLYWSKEIYRIFQLDPARFTPSYETFLNAIHPEDREAVNDAYTRSLDNRTPYEIVHRLLMGDGRVKYVQERCETTYGDDGKPLKSIGTVQDITERHLAVLAREQAEERSSRLVEQLKSTVAVLEQRDRDLVLLSEMLESLMTCHESDEALNIVHAFSQRLFERLAGAIVVQVPEAGEAFADARCWGTSEDPQTMIAAMQTCLADQRDKPDCRESTDVSEDCPTSDSREIVCVPLLSDGVAFGSLLLRELPDGHRKILPSDREMAVTVAEGLSLALSNVEMRNRLYAESTKDPLTQVYNRRFFLKTVRKATELCARDRARFAVHVLDLDDFKAVNDRFGHPAGDELIAMVAKRLKAAAGTTATVARLGGDEFAILERLGPGTDAAAELAVRILDSLGQPFSLSGHQVSIGASIGIAVMPDHGIDADQLMRNADLALYKVKSEGRRGFCFFEAALDAEVRSRRALETDLLLALPRDQFELHYQPIVDASTRETVSLEALVRWRHPKRGLLQPDGFIPIAEETGLIVPIGRWIVNRACADASTWPAHIKVAVNLSAVQFRSNDIVAIVAGALGESRLAPHRLELEITESVLLQKYDESFSLLRELRHLGVSIVLDDFGTGYSSLRYLKEFRFDKIKIDRSFVAEISGNADSDAIVSAIAGLGRSMGIDTTAEGIETEEQFLLLRAAGCTQMQGFLLGRPQPVAELDLRSWPAGVPQLQFG